MVAEQLLRLLHHCGMPAADVDLLIGPGTTMGSALEHGGGEERKEGVGGVWGKKGRKQVQGWLPIVKRGCAPSHVPHPLLCDVCAAVHAVCCAVLCSPASVHPLHWVPARG